MISINTCKKIQRDYAKYKKGLEVYRANCIGRLSKSLGVAESTVRNAFLKGESGALTEHQIQVLRTKHAFSLDLKKVLNKYFCRDALAERYNVPKLAVYSICQIDFSSDEDNSDYSATGS